MPLRPHILKAPLVSLPLLFILPLLFVLWGSCADTNVDNPICEAGSINCIGNMALKCTPDGSGWLVDQNCADQNLTCTSKGCLFCEPGELICRGLDLIRCNAEGSDFLSEPELTCDGDKGMMCDGGGCTHACELARANRSYVGCEYWAVDLDNAVVEIGAAAAQQYALALSNPSPLSATVTVQINEAAYGEPVKLKELGQWTVKPQALQVILLPSREVDGSPPGQYNAGSGTAVTSNAYKLSSTAPLIVYQFNPLSNVDVFSNDASLLIPTSALTVDAANMTGANYLVMGWPQTIATTDDPMTNFGEDLRAFLTIVGTHEETTIRVQLSTDIKADDAGLIKATKKGETFDFTLNPFDVLNLETDGFNADFTGTRVDTDRPVVVFSGSEASDVPDFEDVTMRRCCADHLEEQLFPVPTLGTTFIALTTAWRSHALAAAGATLTPHKETEYFRLLSTGEFNVVTTSLPAPQDTFTIAGGNFVQLSADQDFIIQANDPLVVGQFMASQHALGIPSELPGGDPSFILLPPVEQFRKDYLFLTPDKYAFDFIGVAAPRAAVVTLDGRLLREGAVEGPGSMLVCTVTPVGEVRLPGDKEKTEFVAYKCQLSFPSLIQGEIPPDNLLPGKQNDGVHRLLSDQPVGLVVYGFDAFVSYGYPGGTDLALINLK